MSFRLLCRDSASVEKAEGHLLGIKQEMEEGSLL